jgi:lauroyl/myristoyl acyltransferase
MIIYRLAEIGRFLISRLPACVGYSIAAGIGDVMYYTWPRGRRNMIKCVANILNRNTDDYEIRNTARHCMRNFIKYILDMLRYSNSDNDFFEKQFQLCGREHLDAALKEGKGVILVSFHLGNLDLGIKLLSSLGYPVNAIVDNLGWSGQLDTFLQKSRTHNGVKIISAKGTSSSLLEVLKRNEILALMIDCPNFGKGVKIKLGQKWVMLPTGAATLALRTGARLIPCGLVSTSNTTFKGIIAKPIEYQRSGRLAEDIRGLTQGTVQSLEEMVISFVDQWYIFHPLIKDELQSLNNTSDKDSAFFPVN